MRPLLRGDGKLGELRIVHLKPHVVRVLDHRQVQLHAVDQAVHTMLAELFVRKSQLRARKHGVPHETTLGAFGALLHGHAADEVG